MSYGIDNLKVVFVYLLYLSNITHHYYYLSMRVKQYRLLLLRKYMV